MGTAGTPQRRAILTGGLAATTAALLTACSSKTDSTTKGTAAAAGASTSPSPGAAARPDSPWAAFARLMDGNKRWVDGRLQHPDRDPKRREFVAEEQKPYGVILSCIDSRVPPELLFDTGLGDLFVMRTGGQVVGPVVVGSVEYGPMTSGTPLIVVLGHQRCGAVKAAYEALRDGKELPGNLQSIADALEPAVRGDSQGQARRPGRRHDPRSRQSDRRRLRSNKDLAPMVKKGDLAVVSAYYSLDTGRVEVLSGAPSA